MAQTYTASNAVQGDGLTVRYKTRLDPPTCARLLRVLVEQLLFMRRQIPSPFQDLCTWAADIQARQAEGDSRRSGLPGA